MTVRTGERPEEKARQQWRDRLMRLLIVERQVPPVAASTLADIWWSGGADTERLARRVMEGVFLGHDIEHAIAAEGGRVVQAPTGVSV